jgi:hypothetical protein
MPSPRAGTPRRTAAMPSPSPHTLPRRPRARAAERATSSPTRARQTPPRTGPPRPRASCGPSSPAEHVARAALDTVSRRLDAHVAARPSHAAHHRASALLSQQQRRHQRTPHEHRVALPHLVARQHPHRRRRHLQHRRSGHHRAPGHPVVGRRESCTLISALPPSVAAPASMGCRVGSTH